VSVIDAATKKVVATIKLPGKPEYQQVDGRGNVYDNIESRNSIVRLDARTRTVTAEWPLAGCESPSGLAIDPDHARLFSVCDGKVMAAVDAQSGKVLKLIPIGDGPDAARYDAKSHVAFSSNEDGTLTVVNTRQDAFNVVQSLKTEPSGRTMAFDRATGGLYVLVARFGPKPAPTKLTPNPRPTGLPGTFKVLVIGRK
jgi:DNA-binding beta-propeller fold protein YncE